MGGCLDKSAANDEVLVAWVTCIGVSVLFFGLLFGLRRAQQLYTRSGGLGRVKRPGGWPRLLIFGGITNTVGAPFLRTGRLPDFFRGNRGASRLSPSFPQAQNNNRYIHDLWCSEGFVNKTDDDSDDRPLDEVSHSLSQSEFQPDVQVYVVVQHKCANHENANENAQAGTFRSARSALMEGRENYRDNQDRYQSCGHSNWHNTHHLFLRPEYGRVLVGFIDKRWHQPKHQKTKGKIRDRAAKRRQSET